MTETLKVIINCEDISPETIAQTIRKDAEIQTHLNGMIEQFNDVNDTNITINNVLDFNDGKADANPFFVGVINYIKRKLDLQLVEQKARNFSFGKNASEAGPNRVTSEQVETAIIKLIEEIEAKLTEALTPKTTAEIVAAAVAQGELAQDVLIKLGTEGKITAEELSAEYGKLELAAKFPLVAALTERGVNITGIAEEMSPEKAEGVLKVLNRDTTTTTKPTPASPAAAPAPKIASVPVTKEAKPQIDPDTIQKRLLNNDLSDIEALVTAFITFSADEQEKIIREIYESAYDSSQFVLSEFVSDYDLRDVGLGLLIVEKRSLKKPLSAKRLLIALAQCANPSAKDLVKPEQTETSVHPGETHPWLAKFLPKDFSTFDQKIFVTRFYRKVKDLNALGQQILVRNIVQALKGIPDDVSFDEALENYLGMSDKQARRLMKRGKELTNRDTIESWARSILTFLPLDQAAKPLAKIRSTSSAPAANDDAPETLSVATEFSNLDAETQNRVIRVVLNNLNMKNSTLAQTADIPISRIHGITSRKNRTQNQLAAYTAETVGQALIEALMTEPGIGEKRAQGKLQAVIDAEKTVAETDIAGAIMILTQLEKTQQVALLDAIADKLSIADRKGIAHQLSLHISRIYNLYGGSEESGGAFSANEHAIEVLASRLLQSAKEIHQDLPALVGLERLLEASQAYLAAATEMFADKMNSPEVIDFIPLGESISMIFDEEPDQVQALWAFDEFPRKKIAEMLNDTYGVKVSDQEISSGKLSLESAQSIYEINHAEPEETEAIEFDIDIDPRELDYADAANLLIEKINTQDYTKIAELKRFYRALSSEYKTDICRQLTGAINSGNPQLSKGSGLFLTRQLNVSFTPKEMGQINDFFINKETPHYFVFDILIQAFDKKNKDRSKRLAAVESQSANQG